MQTINQFNHLNDLQLSQCFVVLSLFGGICGTLFLLISTGTWIRKKKLSKIESKVPHSKEQSLIFLDSFLPVIFSSQDSFFLRMSRELINGHSLVQLMTLGNTREKMILALEIFTSQSLLIFLLAAFFTLNVRLLKLVAYFAKCDICSFLKMMAAAAL